MSTNMNREQKRQLRKIGALNEQGAPVREPRQQAQTRLKEARTPPREFLREVRGELRKVAWPTKEEVRKYSIVVLLAVVIVTAFVAGLDFGFGKLILWLFENK